MSDTNYVQVDANGFKCLNGHPVVQKTYDGSPWLCNDPSCKYSVKTVEPKLSPNPSEDRWLDELFAKEIATNEPYLNKGWSLAKAKITSHYEQRMQEERLKAKAGVIEDLLDNYSLPLTTKASVQAELRHIKQTLKAVKKEGSDE